MTWLIRHFSEQAFPARPVKPASPHQAVPRRLISVPDPSLMNGSEAVASMAPQVIQEIFPIHPSTSPLDPGGQLDFRLYVEDDSALQRAYAVPPRQRDVVVVRENGSVSIHLDGLSYLNLSDVAPRPLVRLLER